MLTSIFHLMLIKGLKTISRNIQKFVGLVDSRENYKDLVLFSETLLNKSKCTVFLINILKFSATSLADGGLLPAAVVDTAAKSQLSPGLFQLSGLPLNKIHEIGIAREWTLDLRSHCFWGTGEKLGQERQYSSGTKQEWEGRRLVRLVGAKKYPLFKKYSQIGPRLYQIPSTAVGMFSPMRSKGGSFAESVGTFPYVDTIRRSGEGIFRTRAKVCWGGRLVGVSAHAGEDYKMLI